MNLDLNILSDKMMSLYNNVIIRERILELINIKDELYEKMQVIVYLKTNISRLESGKKTKMLLEALSQIVSDLKELYDNFEDKLMIFIIGNGNVGKSTLLNALVGAEVAETNFIPNTWKIDIYCPDLDKDKAVIKYINGIKEEMLIGKAVELISKEEKKSKDCKKIYNDNLNAKLKGITIKEEREEIKSFLAEKYLYKSNIAEVKWPVSNNWILEKCLLVDTPGLNQDLHSIKQLGSINDYYHKADGVLWILDGQTIAASNTKMMMEDLSSVLKAVGGIRDNIIGVINRMDLIKKNGGLEAEGKVMNDANDIFGSRYSKIIGISAKKAFEALVSNDPITLEASGILELQKAIRELFIAKAEGVKSRAKVQGLNKLINLSAEIIDNFYSQVENYKCIYYQKTEELSGAIEKFKKGLELDIKVFFLDYLLEVESRVNIYIDSLADGKGSNYIREVIYKEDDLIVSINRLIENKQLEIKNKILTWERIITISEFRYIANSKIVSQDNIEIYMGFDLIELNDIEYFIPSMNGDLFAFVGNIFGKAMFAIRKNSIKDKINLAIKKQCLGIENELVNQFNDIIDKKFKLCKEKRDYTFKELLFNFRDIEAVIKVLEECKKWLYLRKGPVHMKDILS